MTWSWYLVPSIWGLAYESKTFKIENYDETAHNVFLISWYENWYLVASIWKLAYESKTLKIYLSDKVGEKILRTYCIICADLNLICQGEKVCTDPHMGQT